MRMVKISVARGQMEEDGKADMVDECCICIIYTLSLGSKNSFLGWEREQRGSNEGAKGSTEGALREH